MALARCTHRRLFLIHTLGVASSLLVLLTQNAIAQPQTVTYRIYDAYAGTLLREIESSSGLAVYTTMIQPVRFELQLFGGNRFGRFVPVGDPLTGPEAAMMGPYFPSSNVSGTTQWEFAQEGAVGHSRFAATQESMDHYQMQIVYPILRDGDKLYQSYTRSPGQVIDSLGIASGSPWAIAEYLNGANAYMPPLTPLLDLENENLSGLGGTLYTVGDDMAWQIGASETEFRGFLHESILKQQSFPFITLTLGPDPFKAGVDGGGGSFDDTNIVAAIIAQTNMQSGFYTAWDSIYDELHTQLTGGGTEMDWIARDGRRDGFLAEIRDEATTANDHLALIASRAETLTTQGASRNTLITNTNSLLNSILTAIVPAQIPPTVPDISASLDALTYEADPDADLIQPTPADVLPDGWDLPNYTPSGTDPQWTFYLPLGDIPLIQDAFDDIQVEVDMTPYHTIIQAAHVVIISLFTIGCLYSVIAETEKH